MRAADSSIFILFSVVQYLNLDTNTLAWEAGFDKAHLRGRLSF